MSKKLPIHTIVETLENEERVIFAYLYGSVTAGEKGNDIDSIKSGLTEAKSLTGKGKPVCILLHTEMGNGVDFMMYTHAWHGKPPSDAQLEDALNQNPETLGDY